MTKPGSTPRRIRTLASRELAAAPGGLIMRFEEEFGVKANKEWNDDWLAPKLSGDASYIVT